MVAYEGTDAGILTSDHHLQVLRLALWIIFCIGIQRTEHGFDARGDDLVGIQRVYIEQVEVLVQLVENIQVLGNLEIVVLLCERHHRRGNGEQQEAESSHIYLIFRCVLPSGIYAGAVTSGNLI